MFFFRSTAKATLFLMPIFGTQFLLTAMRPTTTDCIGEQIYYYVFYTIEGLQGFIVAILYCYVNKEVSTYDREKLRYSENVSYSWRVSCWEPKVSAPSSGNGLRVDPIIWFEFKYCVIFRSTL